MSTFTEAGNMFKSATKQCITNTANNIQSRTHGFIGNGKDFVNNSIGNGKDFVVTTKEYALDTGKRVIDMVDEVDGNMVYMVSMMMIAMAILVIVIYIARRGHRGKAVYNVNGGHPIQRRSDKWYHNITAEHEPRVTSINTWGYRTMSCHQNGCELRAKFGHERGGLPLACHEHYTEYMVKSFGCANNGCNRKAASGRGMTHCRSHME